MRATVVSRVESYVKRLNRGTVFTFDTVVSRVGVTQKDTVNHALKKLTRSNEIVHVKKGVYVRPRMSRFGAIPVEPGKLSPCIMPTVPFYQPDRFLQGVFAIKEIE